MKNRSQTGAIAVLVALLLPALMGLMALAIDMGIALLRRNQMQVAADSAALSAANARQHGQDISTATLQAQTASTANGFKNAQANTTVLVAIPPGGSESFAADTGYARVTITQPSGTLLAWVFGALNVTTSATAVAGPASSAQPCLLTLGASGSGALSVTGNATVTTTSCGIFVNSNSPSALQVTGNITLTATPIQVVGGYTRNGNVTISPVTTGAAAASDPFANLPLPGFSGCTFTNYAKSGNGNVVLTPGTYCGGITMSGNLGVTFSPGVYVLYGGGLNLSGNISPIKGTDVTFYNSGNSSTYPYSSLSLSGNLTLNLSAPTTGNYAGMLFMQDPLNSRGATIVGNSGAILAGNLYFPSSTFTLTGNSGTSIPTGSVVAQKVSISGNTMFTMTNTYGPGGGGSARSGLYQ
ncbi:Putative Flp pilus-assembly TadG-like, N-terminal [Burkholderiaceae bacterium]